jgi:hypothetical protein
MPKQSTEYLIQLIQRLTKAEKRNFRLYVNRNGNQSSALFVQLFDFLVKEKSYDERKILKRIPGIKAHQLSNLKANLYKQLLSSIRHIKKDKQIAIKLHENIDYARILYNKGLYRPSLSLLEKTKKLAIKKGFYTNALLAVEFEKYIESQYVTGSMYPKAREITDNTEDLINRLKLTHRLSNLSLSMYALYLQFGHVKKGENYLKVTEHIKSQLPSVEIDKMDFHQKLYYFQSLVWYYYMIQDFPNNYRYAQKWVDLFEEYPEKKYIEIPLYFKGLHNVLSALFMNKRHDRFLPPYQALMAYNKNKHKLLTRNEKGQLLLYQSIHRIHRIFLTGEYDLGVHEMPVIQSILSENLYNWDFHRILVLNYKIACVYFGANKLETSIDILNEITNSPVTEIREDIQCYARILNLVAHFDLGNDLLVSYQIKSVYRFLLRFEQEEKVLQEIFKFLRKTPNMLASELRTEFIDLRKKLLRLVDDPFERRPFIYFDIISWLNSKINNSTIQVEIKKALQLKIAENQA